MRPTRREILSGALALPLSFSISEAQIIHGHTLLSEESAKGFRLLLRAAKGPLIILPAAWAIPRFLALRLRRAALAGNWILIESGLCFEAAQHWAQFSNVLRDYFNIRIAAPFRAQDRYIGFDWPQRTLVRTFVAVTPVSCSATELIARCDGAPAALRRSIGRGGVIFLGSMLGPALAAEEREAHAVGSGIVSALK